jgi:hypothetical protein
VGEPITVDKWFRPIEQPRAARSTAYLYLTPADAIYRVPTVDGWQARVPEIHWPAGKTYFFPGTVGTFVYGSFTSLGDVRRFVVVPIARNWQIAPITRRWQTKGTMISTLKDPNSVEDFLLDWSAEIGADPIASVAWAVNGVTLVASSNTASTGTARLSGGAVGTPARATCTVTLASGQVKERTIQLQIAIM